MYFIFWIGYENEIENIKSNLPDILCAITGKDNRLSALIFRSALWRRVTDFNVLGKGPLKAHYKAIIACKNWKHIEIITPWLEAEDYPKLLGK